MSRLIVPAKGQLNSGRTPQKPERKLPPFVRVAWKYVDDVLDGKIVTGHLVRLACERHVRDLENADARGLYFDPVAAARVLEFFPQVLRHSKGEWAGKPIELSPWQQFRLASVFGWKFRETGLRRFRQAYNTSGRKQGKSTESAGIGLYMLAADGEPGAEIFSYASKMDQAKIVWNEGKSMVRKAPMLIKHLRLGVSRISFARKESFWAPLSRDKESMDGLNPHLAIADEVHAHKTREAYDVIESAFGSRRQPLHWLITTRGSNPLNICGELDDYASKILRGEVHDDRFFAYIACLDDGDAWDDESAWAKANPNLNISVKLDNLRDEATKARHMPGRQNEFRRKRCNLWTEAVERWIDFEAWMACRAAVDDHELVGRPSWTTLDLSGSRDLTAMVTLYDLGGGRVAVRCRFWLPEDGLDEREKQDRVPYRLWAQQGWLELTPGPTVNLRTVADCFAEVLSQPGAAAGGYDRYKIKEIQTQLRELGFAHYVAAVDTFGNVKLEHGQGIPLVPIGQGFKDMGAAVVELERLILESAFLHGGNPLLSMCAANAVVEFDASENRKFSKAKATGRIDGIVAAAMSALLRKRVSADKPRSVYEQLAAMAETVSSNEVEQPERERSPFRRWFEAADADDED